jgi:SAM-dependent methyltransferase
MAAADHPRCRFCDATLEPTGDVCRDRPDVGIGACPDCGLVQLLQSTHVAVSHYEGDDFLPGDPEAWRQREAHWNASRAARLVGLLPDHRARRLLDFGCGAGGFLRHAEGLFAEVVGFDVSPRMQEANRAAGWNIVASLDDVPAGIDTIVLFHVLEHLIEPWDFLHDLVGRFPVVDRVVVETPNTDEALNTVFRSDMYRCNHFNAYHVYYFAPATLRRVVERAGLQVIVESQLQRYPLGNTFGWLAEGRGGGQDRWPAFSDERLHGAYEQVLVEQGVADSLFVVCAPAGCG